MVIGVKPEHQEAYRAAHRAVPPAVLRSIRDCNVRNYPIILRSSVLYSYFEYVGTDVSANMGGVSEFLTVSLLERKCNMRVVPHFSRAHSAPAGTFCVAGAVVRRPLSHSTGTWQQFGSLMRRSAGGIATLLPPRQVHRMAEAA